MLDQHVYMQRINKVNYFVNIDWAEVKTERFWYKNEWLTTHLMNTYSILVPEFERFIVKSLKSYESEIVDPRLKQRLQHFYTEECAHSLQHARFNQDLKRHNYPIDFILNLLKKGSQILNKIFSKKSKLAMSVAFEHLTVLSVNVAFEQQIFEIDSSAIHDLWLWHGYEERNHRAFLMEVYDAIGGGYVRRCLTLMFSAFLIFMCCLPFFMSILVVADMRQGKKLSVQHIKIYLKSLWQMKGMISAYFKYFSIHI